MSQLLDMVLTRAIQLRRHRENIEKALEYTHGTYTFDDVCRHCIYGKYHFFENNDSFLIGYEVQYPQAKAFHVFLAGGDLVDLVPMYDLVYEFARQLGCTKSTFTGRRGWKHVMESRGWSELSTTFAIDLVDQTEQTLPNQLELELTVH